MNQMNEYWIVIDKRTGRTICHCGEERDAIQMLLFDCNRIYKKQKFISEQVINISSSRIKELPGQLGLPESKTSLPDLQQQVWLPESKKIPLDLK